MYNSCSNNTPLMPGIRCSLLDHNKCISAQSMLVIGLLIGKVNWVVMRFIVGHPHLGML